MLLRQCLAEERHEVIDTMGDPGHMARAGREPLPPSPAHRERSTASGGGSLPGVTHLVETETQRVESVPGSACQWVRFPGIAWRTDEQPRRRRIDPPRASRWSDL